MTFGQIIWYLIRSWVARILLIFGRDPVSIHGSFLFQDSLRFYQNLGQDFSGSCSGFFLKWKYRILSGFCSNLDQNLCGNKKKNPAKILTGSCQDSAQDIIMRRLPTVNAISVEDIVQNKRKGSWQECRTFLTKILAGCAL